MAHYIVRVFFTKVLCMNAWKRQVSLRVVFYVSPKLTSELYYTILLLKAKTTNT